MSPDYKLIYMNARGSAECIRFLFKYGGIDFEDVRINMEDWAKNKEKTGCSGLPIMEHKGKKITQGNAICRYLGKIVKLTGSNDWENLEIDAIVDTICELRSKLTSVYYEENAIKKRAALSTVVKETIPYYFARLNAIAEENNGHLAIGRLTWADFYFASLGPTFDNLMGINGFAKYANLKTVRDNVEALPAIKQWIESRPRTEY